jgi:hypothetical protein
MKYVQIITKDHKKGDESVHKGNVMRETGYGIGYDAGGFEIFIPWSHIIEVHYYDE